MKPLKPPRPIMESPTKLSVHGPSKVKLIFKPLKVVTEDTLFPSKNPTTKDNPIFMPESVLPNKKMILKDKLTLLKPNIQTTKLSKILVQESTLKEKVSCPWLTKSLKQKLKKLWLPTQTVLQDLDMSFWNMFVKSLEQKSELFQNKNTTQLKNYQKTLCQLSQSLVQDTMVSETTTLKAKKLRIYPNIKQKKMFSQFFGTSRYIYNQAVSHNRKLYQTQKQQLDDDMVNGCCHKIKGKRCGNKLFQNLYFCEKHKKQKIRWKIIRSPITMRKAIMINDKDLTKNNKWLSFTPYDTRELMIRSYCGALESAITSKKNGTINCFKIQYKKKNDNRQLFFLNSNALKVKKNKNTGNDELHIFKTRLKKQSQLNIKKVVEATKNCSILKDGNKYFLIIPHESKRQYETPTLGEVALDPGVRTFQTFYSPSGMCGNLDLKQKLIDKLEIRIKNLEKARKRSGKRLRLRAKIKNVVSDGQWKIVKFLVKNFNTIIIPKFGCKDMVKNGSSKLNKGTKKRMLTLSHYKFIEKLKFKCKEYQRELVICGEEYTSQMCGSCGLLNKKLGGSKVFKCSCGVMIDRDLNGSRNIYIKNATSK